jgi:hypothetical protein
MEPMPTATIFTDPEAWRRYLKATFGPLYEVTLRARFRIDPLWEDTGGDNWEAGYFAEGASILLELPRARSLADVRHVIHQEFIWWSDRHTAGAEERWDPAARAIWNAWRRYRSDDSEECHGDVRE